MDNNFLPLRHVSGKLLVLSGFMIMPLVAIFIFIGPSILSGTISGLLEGRIQHPFIFLISACTISSILLWALALNERRLAGAALTGEFRKHRKSSIYFSLASILIATAVYGSVSLRLKGIL
jgi:hypothetical protein